MFQIETGSALLAFGGIRGIKSSLLEEERKDKGRIK